MPKIIQLADNWGLGNRFFGFILARCIQMKVPNAFVEGYDLADWGHRCEDRSVLPQRTVRINSHLVPIDHLGHAMRSGRVEAVYVGWMGARVSYFEHMRDEISSWFAPQRAAPEGYGSDRLVVSIRLAEILEGLHPDYRPLPISFYEQVVDETGLRPVFLGQLGDDPYTSALRTRFPEAIFVPSGGPFEDFETLRRSKNIVLSVSTFSWMAAWLSGPDTTIWMLCAGFYNQRQRPDQDLMPASDPRYRFYDFPASHWRGSASELHEAIASTNRYVRVERARLAFIPEDVRRALGQPQSASTASAGLPGR